MWTTPESPTRGSVPVAIKVLKRKIPGPPDPEGRMSMVDVPASWRDIFMAEALISKALHHPNVVLSYGCVRPSKDTALDFLPEVQSRDFWEADKEPLMFAQEYCDGGSLLDKVRQPGSYTAREALLWCVDVAAGMEYLHSRTEVRVAHRDLKLENIVLSGGRAKVVDFGLARLIVHDELSRGHAELPFTTSPARKPSPLPGQTSSPPNGSPNGSPKGSLSSDVTGQTGSMRYMAPEVWASESYTHKVDVFSFAILAFELLSRTRAYESQYLTMQQVARAVAESALRPNLPKRWPAALSELLARSWAHNADDRPEFAEIHTELCQMKARADSVSVGLPNELYDALVPPVRGCCTVQ
ncbi:serine threonine-protein kinase ht1-like protein [Chrysochromulina tobinii]|uniref:Serine threonine-protein kinase ht1-like protein n=1 Tax=Chrysochromulina tobinii TaxID=1460289 RepID=A0A0M0K0Z7_9EUKA|nr:serine threonine-protein kinase ht1-like protein [Chrysochromulina tobinii]|eukprot:KOO32469.1 serine threonine-protein kinase ht1-like protein [Chrysochromulina sp. CCMP291]